MPSCWINGPWNAWAAQRSSQSEPCSELNDKLAPVWVAIARRHRKLPTFRWCTPPTSGRCVMYPRAPHTLLPGQGQRGSTRGGADVAHPGTDRPWSLYRTRLRLEDDQLGTQNTGIGINFGTTIVLGSSSAWPSPGKRSICLPWKPQAIGALKAMGASTFTRMTILLQPSPPASSAMESASASPRDSGLSANSGYCPIGRNVAVASHCAHRALGICACSALISIVKLAPRTRDRVPVTPMHAHADTQGPICCLPPATAVQVRGLVKSFGTGDTTVTVPQGSISTCTSRMLLLVGESAAGDHLTRPSRAFWTSTRAS